MPNASPLFIPALGVGAVLFWLGTRFERRAVLWVAIPLAIPGTLFAMYYTHLFDNAIWFCEFRTIPFSELAAGGVGLLAGYLHARFGPQSLGEKLAAPLAATALILIPFVKPMLSPIDIDRLHADCAGEVCMQSTFSTCGPSSAATILRAIGRRSSEQELARECYTYRGGTENWYLARALRRRGLKAAFIVQPPERAELPHPAIAGVVLSGGSIVGGGAGHFVAVLDQTGDTVTIADPLKGKLILKRSEIGKHYRLTGFFLMVRMR